jgi:hypothetical protein
MEQVSARIAGLTHGMFSGDSGSSIVDERGDGEGSACGERWGGHEG